MTHHQLDTMTIHSSRSILLLNNRMSSIIPCFIFHIHIRTRHILLYIRTILPQISFRLVLSPAHKIIKELATTLTPPVHSIYLITEKRHGRGLASSSTLNYSSHSQPISRSETKLLFTTAVPNFGCCTHLKFEFQSQLSIV
jgi:hypothetical protein